MNKIVILLAAAATSIALGLSPALAADEAPLSKQAEKAEKALREGAEKMLKALEMLIQSVPQYEAPKVDDNGDIIIRRKNPGAPKPDDPKKAPPADDHTST
jgi:hypothetical protein